MSDRSNDVALGADAEPRGQWIGGRWSPSASGVSRPLINPANERVLTTLDYGGAPEIHAAIDAAEAAAPAWAARTPWDRSAILERAASLIRERAERFAHRTTEESGKPLQQAKAEWLSAPNYLLQAAEEARRLGGRWIPARLPGRKIDVSYAPLGVVGVITAWNFPVYNPNRTCASALAAGNTVVLRPAESTPRTAFDYALTLAEAGVPDGVLNVVHGEPEACGQALLNDPRVRKIAFTGSTRVGRLLFAGAAPTLKRLSLELGGNAPVLIFDDVSDIRALARAAVVARLRNAGQVCISPQRFLVHRRVHDAFRTAMLDAVREERVGDPFDPATTVGPLITATQRDRVAHIVDGSVGAGALLLAGGGCPPGPGHFYDPTVLDAVPPVAPAFREEIFGPVFPITPFADEAEALRLAADTDAGLAAFVFTDDLRRAFRVSDALPFGLIGVNDWYPVSAEAPFGGVGASGVGRESGAEGALAYVETKTRYWGALG